MRVKINWKNLWSTYRIVTLETELELLPIPRTNSFLSDSTHYYAWDPTIKEYIVHNKHKFFLSVIKYGIQFEEIC